MHPAGVEFRELNGYSLALAVNKIEALVRCVPRQIVDLSTQTVEGLQQAVEHAVRRRLHRLHDALHLRNESRDAFNRITGNTQRTDRLINLALAFKKVTGAVRERSALKEGNRIIDGFIDPQPG